MKPLTTLTIIAGSIASAIGCPASSRGEVDHGNVAFDVSPSGKTIVFSGADGNLYVFHLDTKQVDGLTNTEQSESSPGFSPDGESIVYSAGADERRGSCLFIRTLDDKPARRLTNDARVSDDMPCFSQDGERIAFARAQRHRPYSMGGWIWDNYDIYVMARDGTNVRRVTSHNYYQAGNPGFIEGGKTLVYAAEGDYPDSRTYLLSVPTDGSRPPKRLTTPANPGGNFAAWCSSPSVSRDGKRITFVSDRAAAFRYDLWVMNTDGADARPLGVTKVSRYNHKPVFLPDNKGVLFLAAREYTGSNRPIFSLWQVDVDGKNAHMIADSGLFTDPLHWNPKP
jgi:Tol biopolymer transport system component